MYRENVPQIASLINVQLKGIVMNVRMAGGVKIVIKDVAKTVH